MNRKIMIGGAVAASLIAAPAYAQSADRVVKDGAIGAGAGAVAGLLIGGLPVAAGALIGAAGGLAFAAIAHHRHHYYHDSYGRRYTLDREGQRIYR